MDQCSIDACELPIRNKKRQLCNMHYLRWRRHGDVHWGEEKYLTRFDAKVDKTGDCWLWTGTRIDAGYGVVHRNGKRLYAHRVAYEDAIGPIPVGLVIDHLCRVKRCVRPEHLEPVTQAENVRRGIGPTAVNSGKTYCIRNHALFGSNLYVIQATGYRQCKKCTAVRRNRRKDR